MTIPTGFWRIIVLSSDDEMAQAILMEDNPETIPKVLNYLFSDTVRIKII